MSSSQTPTGEPERNFYDTQRDHFRALFRADEPDFHVLNTLILQAVTDPELPLAHRREYRDMAVYPGELMEAQAEIAQAYEALAALRREREARGDLTAAEVGELTRPMGEALATAERNVLLGFTQRRLGTESSGTGRLSNGVNGVHENAHQTTEPSGGENGDSASNREPPSTGRTAESGQ